MVLSILCQRGGLDITLSIWPSFTTNTNPLMPSWEGSITRGGGPLGTVVSWDLKCDRNLDGTDEFVDVLDMALECAETGLGGAINPGMHVMSGKAVCSGSCHCSVTWSLAYRPKSQAWATKA